MRALETGDPQDRADAARPITPRRSTTRHHYTHAGSWDERRIVAALREWASEVGEPPRTYEWCPGSARSAGLIGPGECKWEREHPRWPGNTTVYRYFVSWGAALEAAGIEPRHPGSPEGTLAERVDAATRMYAAGERVRAIADTLRVSPQTARTYLRAHPCQECAAPVVGDGKLCSRCATRKGNPMRWSREGGIAAVRRWTRLEGQAPRNIDWRAMRLGGAERWEAEFPDWPPASMGTLIFGGWSELLHAAGVEVVHPSWKREQILAALRAYVEEYGGSPSKEDLEWPPTGYPSARTVRRHFGSFTAGLQAAGLQPRSRRWSDEAIVEAMREFELETDFWPRPSDWARACEDWPAAATVYKRFGSWQAALEMAMDVRRIESDARGSR
ncbi:MAG: homing endonuclease associated repeat-containing protein [Solirubrobacteraceae bacterium]